MKKVSVLVVLFISMLVSGCSAKLSIEQYKKIEAGGMVRESFMEMSIQKQSQRKSVEPSKPEGYYHIYEGKKGYYYQCYEGIMTNLSDESMDINNLDVLIRLDGDEYKGKVRLETADGKDLISEIKKGEELSMVVFFLIEDEKNAKVDEIIFRYNEYFRKSSEEDTYVYETALKI